MSLSFLQYPPLTNTPLAIPGCTLWLDSADTTTVLRSNTSNVYQWNDKSGKGINLSVVGSQNPTYTDTVSGINFTSNQLLVNRSAYLNYQTHTIFFVCNQTVAGPTDINGSRVITFVNPNVGMDVSVGGIAYGCIYEQSLKVYGLSGFYDTGFGTTNGQLVPKGIYCDTYNQTSNRIISTYRDGSNIANTGPVNSNYNILSSYSAVIIGAGTSSVNTYTGYWTGNIYEVIVYSNVLTQFDRQVIQNYLSSKWNINLLVNADTSIFNNYYLHYEYPSIPLIAQYDTQLTSFLTLFSTGNSLPSISGLALWLDAADTATITLSGSSVIAWNDKSGNSNNTTFSGTNTYNSINNSVYTSNSSYFYNPVDIRRTTVPNITLFLVHRQINNTTPANQGLWGNDVGGGWNRFQLLNFSAVPSISYGFSIGGGSTRNITALNTLNRVVYSCVLSFNTTNGSAIYVNGSNSATFTETSATTQTSSTNIYFGTIDGSVNGVVEFNEILLYTTALTDTQRQQVESYLANKWGINTNVSNSNIYLCEAIPSIDPAFLIPTLSFGFTS